jgi:hypothetical protein
MSLMTGHLVSGRANYGFFGNTVNTNNPGTATTTNPKCAAIFLARLALEMIAASR